MPGGKATTTTPIRARSAWIGVGVASALIVTAVAIPALTAWEVWANHFPPLHAEWAPHVGPGTIPAIVLAILAARFAVDLAARLPWRGLLPAAFGTAALWLASLALVDGPSGLGAILGSRHEYLRTASTISDVPAFLADYIAHIPLDSVDHWPIHIAGHPPGAVLFFWVLVTLGLGSWPAAGTVVLLLAATVPVAVLLTLRRLGADDAARRAAPLLVFGPAAIWMAVSADAMFAAFAAWGLYLLSVAATAKRRRVLALGGVGSGLVLGYCVFLSYGLPLLGVLAVAILVIARSWWALPWALGGAATVALSFAAGGFAWWQAYPVLVERYWAGIATRRPAGYWIWGNLAALSISAGPLVGSAVAGAVARVRRWREWTSGDRVVVLLTLAAASTILIADLSQMSKAEVERIWLPFVPWLLVGTALLPERWRRGGLVLQVTFALIVQHLLRTGW
ncbi:hypothetical protein HDC94_002587 [Leifsonia sp. AK011]|uniref:hypothetical protein n=1 Tax=Leifsonia sp. AK011 TaxID=2723075 RepID=UPI00182434D9|nr:hypothetical protein [Leifsonia sp. AK011]NYF11431.1 hypothetical protein [Leifsonia sp. AK011]